MSSEEVKQEEVKDNVISLQKKLQEAAMQDAQERRAACMKELQEVCEKYNCSVAPEIVLGGSGVVMAGVVIVPLEPKGE